MIRLLRAQRDFRLLLIGHVVSTLGDWLLRIAVPYYVFQETESPLASAATFFAVIVPQVIVAPFTGVLVDNARRRPAMVGALTVGAAGSLTLSLLAGTDAFLWVVYPVLFVQGSALQLFLTARGAVTQLLVDPEDYMTASSVATAGEQAARLVGPPLGGALLVATSIRWVTALDVLTFVTAIVLVLAVRRSLDIERAPAEPDAEPATDPAPQPDHVPLLRRTVAQVRDGLVVMWQSTALRIVAVVAVASPLLAGVTNAILVPYAEDVLDFGSAATGTMLALHAAGAIAATPLVIRLAERFHPNSAFAFAVGGSAVPLLVLGTVQAPAAVFAAVAVYGGLSVVSLIVARTVILNEAEPEYLGRIISAMTSLFAGSLSVGAAISGLVGEGVGMVASLRVAGVLGIVAGLVIVVLGRAWARPSPQESDPSVTSAVAE